MPSSIRNVACASSSSMRAKAKPTWIRTQSPGLVAVVGEQGYIYPPPGPANVHPGVLSVNAVELGYEPRDPEAHDASS